MDARAMARPAWVLLCEEARLRGFKNALAFRRWCRRSGVGVFKVGRLCAVCPAEVDAAVRKDTAPKPSQSSVSLAVAKLMGRN
jgi:hypothetical protein